MNDIMHEIIIMLAQASELQEKWTPQNGDVFIQDGQFYTIGTCGFHYKKKSSETVLEAEFDRVPVPMSVISAIIDDFQMPKNWIEAKRIWYPSIEQFQNMMDMKKLELTLFFEDNIYYCKIKSDIYKVHDEFLSSPVSSVLWLKMAMYIQYKKFWDGKDLIWTKKRPEEL